MEYLVGAAIAVLIASFVYPPLGQWLRELGSGLQGRNADGPRIGASDVLSPPQNPDPNAPIGARETLPLQQGAAGEPGARPQFGKRKTIEEPRRPPVAPSGQIFNKELFEGEMGDFWASTAIRPTIRATRRPTSSLFPCCWPRIWPVCAERPRQ